MEWLRHQRRVYTFGLGVLMMLAVVAAASALIGAVVVNAVGWLFGYEPGNIDWLAVSLIVAPFGLTSAIRLLGDRAGDAPAPIDLFRARQALRPRRQRADGGV